MDHCEGRDEDETAKNKEIQQFLQRLFGEAGIESQKRKIQQLGVYFLRSARRRHLDGINKPLLWSVPQLRTAGSLINLSAILFLINPNCH